MKRFFDVLLSGLALLVLSPCLIPVIIVLKLTGEHYVFYKQKRIGRNKKEFDLLKFATMLKDSPNLGTGEITTKNDPRVLPFGRILRKTKINELPQLINILLGDMSIIGPRPLTPKHFFYYSEKAQACISQISPGLSGIASVIFRDEETIMSKIDMDYTTCYKTMVTPYKEALEIWYAKNHNLLIDFQIIFLTVWVVVFPKSQLPYKLLKNIPAKPSWMED